LRKKNRFHFSKSLIFNLLPKTGFREKDLLQGVILAETKTRLFVQAADFKAVTTIFQPKNSPFWTGSPGNFSAKLKIFFAGKPNNDRPPKGGGNLWTNFALMQPTPDLRQNTRSHQ